jgi:hypothetical protein
MIIFILEIVDRTIVFLVHPTMVLEHVPLACKASFISRAGNLRAPIKICREALAPVDFTGMPLQTGAVAEGLCGAVAGRAGKWAGMFGHMASRIY